MKRCILIFSAIFWLGVFYVDTCAAQSAGASAGVDDSHFNNPSKQPPIRSKGTISINGKPCSWEAVYWGDRFQTENKEPTGSLPREKWLVPLKNMRTCDTLDEYLSNYTDESRKILEARRPVVQQRFDSRKADRSVIQRNTFPLVIELLSDHEPMLFVVFMVGFVTESEFKPRFDVMVLRKISDRWLDDLNQSDHPIFQDLTLGRWKQYGGPMDWPPEPSPGTAEQIMARRRAATQSSDQR